MQTAAVRIPGRIENILSWKEQGGGIAAVFPIHYPRELLRAFGYLPVEVWGPPVVESVSSAAHVQPYVCSIVRNGLSFLQSGGLELADILLVPHACDSLQGLGSLLLDFIHPRQPTLTLYLPRGRRESDLSFLAQELHALYRRLAEIHGDSPTEPELMSSIRREEAADASLAQLHRQRSRLPLSDLAFYQLIRSREYLPAERFSQLASEALDQAGPITERGIPLLLSGIVPEPMALLNLIPELGGWVAADDLASCGRRLYPAGTSQDPFLRMAERIIHAPPDPTRGSSIESRHQHLLSLAAESGARGVVFHDVKFCEPELFDLPDLRRQLAESGLPSLLLEVDLNDPLSHQLHTRLQAFLEMIV